MRQTTATIERIRELLITSGVPEGEVLEEMLDHYLSDIESQIDLKISSPLAIQATFQKIEKTDFSSLQKKKKSNRYFALVFIFLLLISGWVYQNSFSPNFFEIIASSKEIAPDGWPLKESAPITSNFGLRLHPILKSIKLHKGIDIRAKLGTLVLATGTAVVRETGYTASVGNYIILEHNGRFSSRYQVIVVPPIFITKS